MIKRLAGEIASGYQAERGHSYKSALAQRIIEAAEDVALSRIERDNVLLGIYIHILARNGATVDEIVTKVNEQWPDLPDSVVTAACRAAVRQATG